jgi:heavy metal translocating P-type ATPase
MQIKFDYQQIIAVLAAVAIPLSLLLEYALPAFHAYYLYPLYFILAVGGIPLVCEILGKIFKGDFGADLLAGISIVTACLLEQYLAGSLVVLMLSGGQAIENFSVKTASKVLEALAKRAPSIAHYKKGNDVIDTPIEDIKIGDVIVVFPHETCPVDGEVIEGNSVMDESYLTGEPFMISKAPGSLVMSGAINGDESLQIRATALAVDSRYAKIMQVMYDSQEKRPQMRRLADTLGAWFTPLALFIAIVAWVMTGDPVRFLAVLVIATPCPLLIAIPVAIIGSISMCASRGIIIKNPIVLEQIDRCETVIFDKTGTLTYGKPNLVDQISFNGYDAKKTLGYAASLERYSKHPLAKALLDESEAEGIALTNANQIQEVKGSYLKGIVDQHEIVMTSRKQLGFFNLADSASLLPQGTGLECVVLVDGKLAAYYRFRDTPRADGVAFIEHLGPHHAVKKLMIVSGDREEEVRYLADKLGIPIVYAGKSPEEKLAIVRNEVSQAKTAYLGDGINDAAALMAANVGIAFGQNSDVTSEAAGVVIMDSSLEHVDEFLHISRRMRMIALQGAFFGMGLSLIGMIVAAAGYLPPVAGAIAQEILDVVVIFNSLRTLLPIKSDYTHVEGH